MYIFYLKNKLKKNFLHFNSTCGQDEIKETNEKKTKETNFHEISFN